MNYKVGDKVRIKSLDWYNENKTTYGNVLFDNAVFVKEQSLYCGCVLTIRLVTNNSYHVIENDYYWTDEMIEGLVEEETKPKYEDEVNGEYYSTPKYLVRPNGYQFIDENGNVINAMKIVLEKKPKKSKKSPKTDDLIKWLRERDMTKYIGVLYSGMFSITFDTEKLIKDITEIIGDE